MWTQSKNKASRICHRWLCYMKSTDKRYSSHSEQWTSSNIRKTFVDYFCRKHDHLFIPSSSVYPTKKGGTYFTNAGMNQFKPIFLDTVDHHSKMSSYKRVTNHQKCIRVGGKHNDLDDVGKDLYHNTFFEMLGSWSFGDYFKKEACTMALDLLTQVYGLPINRLYFTYFSGDDTLGLKPDLETRDIWLSLGVPANHILSFGMKDNFWDMGETGPCGPCTEIHYDHMGVGSGAHLVNQGSPLVAEIWNLVFMQYERCKDSSLKSLPRTHVDTGMGLERISAVLQNSTSNYNTDLFIPIFEAIHKETKTRPYQGLVGQEDKGGIDTAYRIVADHLRMSSISIADGLLPNRFGLGAPLRKVMSKCFQQAHDVLRIPEGVLPELVDVVVGNLGEAYPELQQNHKKIKNVTKDTEKWHMTLIADSEKAFKKYRKKMAKEHSHHHITVKDMLDLYKGKYGVHVPPYITEDIATREGFTLESQAFEEALRQTLEPKESMATDEQEILSQSLIESLQQRGVSLTDDSFKYSYTSTDGRYDFLETMEGTVVGLVQDDSFVDRVSDGRPCGIIMDKTMFYSESGGQAADVGQIYSQDASFRVNDVQNYDGYVLHTGQIETGCISMGDRLFQQIDQEHRLGCMRNHTATHLLLAGLRKVMGQDVEQVGSRIYADKLKFDFTSVGKFDTECVSQVENLIQESIGRKEPVKRQLYPREVALALKHVVPLRDEVYPAETFVLSIGSEENLVSAELCGGTHVANTGDVQGLYITSVVRAGQASKRVLAVTGPQTQQVYETGEKLKELYKKIENGLKSSDPDMDLIDCAKEFKMILRTMTVPKVVRDEVSHKFDQIEHQLATAENMVVKAKLEQATAEALLSQDDKKFVIFKCFVKKKPMALKSLFQQKNITKPVCVVSDLEDSMLVILFGPKIFSSNMKDAADRLKQCYVGKVSQQSRNELDSYSVTLRKSVVLSDDAVYEKTRTILEDVC